MPTDKRLSYLHFCGGFGAHAGLKLRNWELTAIRAAQVLHPQATLLLHHAKGSWANAPAEAEQVTYSEDESSQWATWRCSHGAHQSDRVRLLALLKYGGLYQDTDSFMLRNCDHLAELAGCALPLVVRTASNGFVYAEQDSAWLKGLYGKIDQLGVVHGQQLAKLWDKSGTVMYNAERKLSKLGVTMLPGEKYICSKWLKHDEGFLAGPLTEQAKARVLVASVVHVILQSQASTTGMKAKSSLLAEPTPGSTLEFVLSLANLIANGQQDEAYSILNRAS